MCDSSAPPAKSCENDQLKNDLLKQKCLFSRPISWPLISSLSNQLTLGWHSVCLSRQVHSLWAASTGNKGSDQKILTELSSSLTKKRNEIRRIQYGSRRSNVSQRTQFTDSHSIFWLVVAPNAQIFFEALPPLQQQQLPPVRSSQPQGAKCTTWPVKSYEKKL